MQFLLHKLHGHLQCLALFAGLADGLGFSVLVEQVDVDVQLVTVDDATVPVHVVVD
jgi:hypothetical protein